MLNLDYPGILNLFSQHLAPKRNESAAFLIWFLENYYRLDTLEAIDSVCDQRGDKGVDGIYINEVRMLLIFFSLASLKSVIALSEMLLFGSFMELFLNFVRRMPLRTLSQPLETLMCRDLSND